MKEKTIETNTLSLTLLTKPRTKVAVAKISVQIDKNETFDVVTEMYGDILLSGSKKYSREQLTNKLASLGSSITVTERSGICTFTIKGQIASWQETFSIFTEIYKNPSFKKTELTRVKKIYKNKLEERVDDARYMAHRVLLNNLYGKKHRHHGDLPAQLKKQLEAVSVSDFRQLHKQVLRSFTSATAYGSSASNKVFSETLLKLATGTTTQSAPATIAKTPKQPLQITSIESKQNVEYSIGARLPVTITHPEYAPLMFGLSVLGMWGGFTGRLMSTVREQEGLTYGIYAAPERFSKHESGNWRIMTFFSPNKSIQGLTSTLREVRKIASKGITPDEHTRFTTILKSREFLVRDSAQGYTEKIHQYKLAGVQPSEIDAFQERLLTVSKDEVDAALKKYIEPAELTISAAGPIKAIKSELAAFAAKLR